MRTMQEQRKVIQGMIEGEIPCIAMTLTIDL